MTTDPAVKDLMALVADGQMKSAIEGLLTRGLSLKCREIACDIAVHPEKDPGCLLRAHDFLRPFCRQYHYALVMLDREGCGREGRSRETLESEIEQRVSSCGWGDRAAAVVLDPELEIWVWSDSPEVDKALGWTGRTPSLAEWLTSEGHSSPGQRKPKEPKKAVEAALRIARKPRSSAIFRQLAEHVGVERCTDPAFLKLRSVLRRWFGVPEPVS